MRDDKTNSNPSVDKKIRIYKRIKYNGCCVYCIRKWRGQIKKYKTDC